jgi:hypothetical protein
MGPEGLLHSYPLHLVVSVYLWEEGLPIHSVLVAQ